MHHRVVESINGSCTVYKLYQMVSQQRRALSAHMQARRTHILCFKLRPQILGLCDHFNSAAIQQDRTVVYAYTCMSERERECILQLGNSKQILSLCMYVCVCVHARVQSNLLLLRSISIGELVWVHLTNHTHVV